MPGRPRKPTAILELNGAFKHDPRRARPNEPKDDRPFGDPPERMPLEIRPFWYELVGYCAPGVLKVSDRWAIELAARLMHKAVSTPNMAVALELVNTLELTKADARAMLQREDITGAELSTLRTLLSSLGMTPADRTKLSVPTEKKANKFSDIAAEVSVAAPTRRPN